MDKHEAYKILGVSEGATPAEIKKAYHRLSLKHHPDKSVNCRNTDPNKTYSINCGTADSKDGNKVYFCSDEHKKIYEDSDAKFKKINEANEILSNSEDKGDNSDIDEDAIFSMETKIKNAFDYNNVKMEEMEDETIKGYKEKLKKCKTKADLENLTSEIVIFIRIYARARDAGYLDKGSSEGREKPKPTPTTETRSDTDSGSSSPQYSEFTCDWCTKEVGADDPRPKYTFTGVDKAFCSESCRDSWDKSDRWWKDWDEKKKKEAQEWEDYQRQQAQKWADYFKNLNTSSYQSYSTYTSPTSSNSGSSISNWLKEWQERRDKERSEDLAENKKRYIRDVEFKLSLKHVSDSKLNTKLGVSNWRDQINQATDDMEAWSRRFDMENLVEKLSREYTCAKCGAVKDNYYPWTKGGKKYCSLECKDDKDNKRNRDKGEVGELKEEIRKLRDEMRGLGDSVERLSWLLWDWIKREGVISVSLNEDSLVIKLQNGKTENLKESSLTPAQQGLKKYLERSSKKSLNRQELENLVQGAKNQEKANKKGKVAETIGGIIIVAVVIAVVVGIVVWAKKKD